MYCIPPPGWSNHVAILPSNPSKGFTTSYTLYGFVILYFGGKDLISKDVPIGAVNSPVSSPYLSNLSPGLKVLTVELPSNPSFGGHIGLPFLSSHFEAIFDELEVASSTVVVSTFSAVAETFFIALSVTPAAFAASPTVSA
nr:MULTISPECIES: hypothetical protein [Thermoanaerobacterium]